MKHLQKQLLLEQIIYLSIWVLILGTPLIGFLLDNDHPLEGSELWKEVSDTWLMVLPFFLLFLIFREWIMRNVKKRKERLLN